MGQAGAGRRSAVGPVGVSRGGGVPCGLGAVVGRPLSSLKGELPRSGGVGRVSRIRGDCVIFHVV